MFAIILIIRKRVVKGLERVLKRRVRLGRDGGVVRGSRDSHARIHSVRCSFNEFRVHSMIGVVLLKRGVLEEGRAFVQ